MTAERIETAFERFGAALQALQAAAGQSEGQGIATDEAGLLQENQQLNQILMQERALRQQEVRERAAIVAQLDTAILELRRILDS